MMTKKCHCKESEFHRRPDNQILSAFSTHLDRKEAGKICVANCSTKDYWFTDNVKDITRRLNVWKSYRRFPLESFTHEAQILADYGKPIQTYLKSAAGNTPAIFQLWHKEVISSDFMVTLDKAIPFIDDCSEFWVNESGAKLRLTKNRCFVKLDTDSVLNVVRSIFKEH